MEGDSTGLSTDRSAASLGDAVANITSHKQQKRDFLFWFRRSNGVVHSIIRRSSCSSCFKSQVMLLLRERNWQLIRDTPEEVKVLAVYGDQARIQQVLSDLLLNMVRYASEVVVNDADEDGDIPDSANPKKRKKLWGLVVCHNTTPRFVPFPLRYACKVEQRNIHFEIKTHASKSEGGPISLVVNACASRDPHENVVGVCFVAQDITGQNTVMDKFTRMN
ncbi:hypothetical protein Tsubulata_023862 [Turnera subulata]|uniref:Phytochrome chromophore attachment site domain-containing protein n=1 Tax=Turnera subulata TaxID=218843 RepID=A0A9Q0J2Y4_9ROSI|nr:hypothetical protein Tsubulata_023862 [Turnera subulata]